MPHSLNSFSRRRFLKSMAAAAAAAQCGASLNASIVQPVLSNAEACSASKRLDSGWEYYRGALDGPWEVWRGDEIAAWEKVVLPHCFNHYDACDPDTPYYRGHGWYRTRIPVANPLKDGRTLLYFEGAGQTSHVYVANTLIGSHVGGYDEFVFDISEGVAAAHGPGMDPVPIAVLCDNSENLERPPSDLSDFSLYGGLYRHVHLAYVPAVSLEAVHIAPAWVPGGAATVVVKARLYNPVKFSHDCTVAVEITDPSGTAIAHIEKSLAPWDGEAEIASVPVASPSPWSPAQPNLYKCSVTLTTPYGESAVNERFGIKHAEFVDYGPFKLNGERLLLKGTQRHMDHARFAAAEPDDLVRTEMQLAKAMGANFIRLGHYQQARLVLDMCDELGLLVWEEAPWCRSGVGDDKWKDHTRSMLANMIDQHFNHPSVLMWGLGNEDDWPGEYPNMDQAVIREFMQEMNDQAHTMDPSRYTSLRRCDFARDIPDVYSPSIWAGWYSGVYAGYQAALEKEREKIKHFLHIEWGADSHARRHSEAPEAKLAEVASGASADKPGPDDLPAIGGPHVSRDGDWSETYACDLFDWYLKVQETLPWLTGSAQWAFKDFTTPLRVENPVPRVNQKGVLERDMTKKEGYWVFQSYWSEQPMAHIYGHTWPVRWGAEGELRIVKVYSNCPAAELFINGESAGERKRNSQNFPAAGLRWMVTFRPGKNHLRVLADKEGVAVSDEIEFEYQTAKWGKPARLKLAEIARDAETATIEATLFDENGVLCLDAKNVVRFSVAGCGCMIDNQGTSTGSRVVQLYNGRAQISLHRNGGATDAGVTSEGIASAFVTIEA
ncbi:Beta-galactosidase [Candidatus Sulfotelmatomonas gaucii]|uniref:Beta-galactosidase n=1 Tax=Candidatus Sulfuritelmatomonas gaucii TaxID=2043161 RepID=A0A2N9L697_9BACT|nr:Beta-galactosidase [Candidatus Sulfotelmatomonas gaucii]